MLLLTAGERRTQKALPPKPGGDRLLLKWCNCLEIYPPATDPKHYTEHKRKHVVSHPTKLHKAVDDLFSVLKSRAVKDERLVVATMVLHKANFGLLVYKHPRPGIIHVYNKKFGGPLLPPDEPEVGALSSVVGRI